ncbi:MAG: class I SAM-dependent methyltransferase [Simkaniaceae bacterium]|nr:class I SAM-dependent methyltransferase [Simkaniaceae bacterium]
MSFYKPDSSTKDYYNKNALKFAKRTLDLDIEKLYQKFIHYLPENARILDGGCGPGRDAKYFLDQGFQVTAMDFSEEFVKFSTEYTGQETLHLSFQEMQFVEEFDAIWNLASLLHIPSCELNMVMQKLKRALKPGGIWFISFKKGEFEGYVGERYFTNKTKASLLKLVDEVEGLEVLENWEDTIDGQEWVQILLRKK